MWLKLYENEVTINGVASVVFDALLLFVDVAMIHG